MAESHLTVLSHPDFPQVFDAAIERLIARAIVHLNFNEPEQARDVLLAALSDVNFARKEEK
jgi:hypothetical protein